MKKPINNFIQDLYQSYWLPAFRLANRITQSPENAKDIASESLLIVISKVEVYDLLNRYADENGYLKKAINGRFVTDDNNRFLVSLINTVVRNKSNTFLKQSKRIDLVEGTYFLSKMWKEDDPSKDKSEVSNKIYNWSEKYLTAKQLEVFRLKMYENLTLKEIAQIIGVSTSAVTRRWNHAIRHLKRWQQHSKQPLFQ